MIYRAYLGGKEITGFTIGDKSASEIWGGDTLLWKKEEYGEFKFSYLGSISVRLYGKGEINWGDGEKTIFDTETDAWFSHQSIHDSLKIHATIKGNIKDLYFAKQDNLLSVDSPFPKTMKNKANFNYTFYYCTSLSYVNPTLFKYCESAKSVRAMFGHCGNLSSISGTIFYGADGIENFEECFEYTGIRSIPNALFRKSKLAKDFSNCFALSDITAIPYDLFKECELANDFYSVFTGTKITSIPDDVFKYGTSDKRIDGAFAEARFLKSIPKGLLDTCTQTENFGDLFAYTAIENVPSDLMKKCACAKSVSGMFALTSLKTINDDFFDGCPNLFNFSSCFVGNTNLESAPKIYEKYAGREGLTGESCFYGCTSLPWYDTIPSDWRSPVPYV